jgi:hypothetical protein
LTIIPKARVGSSSSGFVARTTNQELMLHSVYGKTFHYSVFKDAVPDGTRETRVSAYRTTQR